MFASTLISPPMTLEKSALFNPMTSRLKPNDPPSYFARVLATEESVATAGWKALQKALHDYGISYFGQDYPTMARQNQVRSPIREDVLGKGWPKDVVAFLNLKSGVDYPPAVVMVGPDGGLARVTDPSLMY